MLVLQLCCFLVGLTSLPFSAHSSPVDSTSWARAPIEIRNSENFRAVEQKFLRSMGMKTRPRPKRGLRIPKYMLELYNNHKSHPDWISTNFRFDDKWTSANTIRAFHHQDDQVITFPDTPERTRIRFDLSTFPRHEKVTFAEFRLFKTAAWSRSEGTNATEVRVNIYQVLNPGLLSRPAITRLIDTRIVNTTENGWETFDVRSALKHWVTYPHNNFGIEVHVCAKDGHSIDTTAVSLKRNATMDDAEWHDQRPLVVAYTHDAQNHHHVRRKRSPPLRGHGRARTRGRLRGRGRGRGHGRPKRRTPHYCRRHPLYVDFSDVGWNDWIVAPPGYYAFYCSGQCPYPITKNLNATNHAIVQTLMNSVDDKVPNVCCVPTTLTPISMLYLDEFEKVVLKNYQEMVVEGCGCR